MTTLLLDTSKWDLVVDASGNIAVADVPYARAQDVCSAIKLFSGELYYNRAKGVPYFADILGQPLDAGRLSDEYVAAAETVAGVESVFCDIWSFNERGLFGRLLLSNTSQINFSDTGAIVVSV